MKRNIKRHKYRSTSMQQLKEKNTTIMQKQSTATYTTYDDDQDIHR